jgi:type II secretory pathway pseudopilin PulG
MELLVAMAVMIFIMGAATTLLTSAFNVRAREDQRSEGTGDARRALNIITREVANAGYRLPINLTYAAPDARIALADEAVKFQFVQDGVNSFLVRRDLITGDSIVLANRIDGAQFTFLDAAGAVTANIADTVRINIRLWVTLNEVGRRGSSGYQAPGQVTLSSDVTLRNVQLDMF